MPAFAIDRKRFGGDPSVEEGVGVRLDADWSVAEVYWDGSSPDQQPDFGGEGGEAVEAVGRGVRDFDGLVKKIWFQNG